MATSEASLTDISHLVDAHLEGLVLGGIFQGGDPAYREVSFLTTDDFTKQSHRVIWGAITTIASEVAPRLDAVSQHLHEIGKLEAAGGFTGLVEIDALAIPGLRLAGFGRSLQQNSADRRAWLLNAKLAIALESGHRDEVRWIAQEILAIGESGIEQTTIRRIEDLPAVSAAGGEVEYIRDPEIPRGSITALTGDSGSGKSTLATAWLRDAIARGIPGLILDRESPRSVAMDRMQRLGLEDSERLRWYGGWLGETPGPDAPMVRAWVRACEPRPVIIIDSLVAFMGADENDARAMRDFMHSVRRLADIGASILVVHHDGKSETARDYRGSSDFKASVDVAFHVANISSDAKLDRLTLRCFKSRYGFTGSLVYNYAEGRLERDQRPDAAIRTAAEQLTDILRCNPGITGDRFEKLGAVVGVSRSRARSFLADGIEANVINFEASGKAKLYRLAGDR